MLGSKGQVIELYVLYLRQVFAPITAAAAPRQRTRQSEKTKLEEVEFEASRPQSMPCDTKEAKARGK